MIIVLKKNISKKEKEDIISRIHSCGLTPHISQGTERTIIGVVGDERILQAKPMDGMKGIEKIINILKPYKLVSRDFKKEDTVINIKGRKIGGGDFSVIAGPCSVESEEQMMMTAEYLSKKGISFLRGGAFKPRTSPYSFQGLGREGLEFMKRAASKYDMLIVSEIMDAQDIELLYDFVDIFQVGARNMQNFILLQELGAIDKPILLKRGMSSTLKEWLMAAEYIMLKGNSNIILCERGIRTFEDYTRNTLDLSAVIAAKNISHLPVFVDPSHGTGRKEMILPMSLASKVIGADGVMVEVHPNPEKALSDSAQSMDFNEFDDMFSKLEGFKWPV
ncbi:MAG: 3-deoxy-7-phosphoheptulonate synthase [Candidatus Muiribacterium halophilum]|uniref:3-deoxy-7-phosphoheptulonate synthase n=1 Tax=Muiribacterium halophilum TaxID=2053465 RepID=A0A2N5ZCH4_MUIH1|nr:MAG: 3-deoxy-7-phosphoheptulonate synthase [Candidatus Muirbacterium halophilum]